MKNFFKIVVLAAIFCLVASCENSIGKKTIDGNDGDKNDTEISDDDTDSGDTEVPDDSDTETPDNPDTDTSDTTDDGDVVDTDTPAVYNTPYGSITLTFDNIIGSEEDPGSSNEVFAKGTYGNGTASVMSEYADKVKTEAYGANEHIYIRQIPIYADGSLGNPVVLFDLPFDKAAAGMYTLNYNGDASVIVAEVDWNSQTTLCYYAFGEGMLEISEANVNYAIKLSGNATLYSPKNYKWEDVSSAFLGIFTDTNILCDPVN